MSKESFISPSFSKSSIDFAGQFECGTTTFKSYVVVFVNLSNKAVHLELASDITTAAFMAAYKRFTESQLIQSDKGTNFLGASKVLDKELK